MSRYNEKDAADDTNTSKKEAEAAYHQARNDAMRSGEPLGNRPLKEDVPLKSEEELQKISAKDQPVSDEQLDKWRQDQAEALELNQSIQVAEKLQAREGPDFLDKSKNAPEAEAKPVSRIKAYTQQEKEHAASSPAHAPSNDAGEKQPPSDNGPEKDPQTQNH